MPSYEYECPGDATTQNIIVSIHDTIPESIQCDICGAKMRRVYTPFSVKFNAKGFYKTDNR